MGRPFRRGSGTQGKSHGISKGPKRYIPRPRQKRGLLGQKASARLGTKKVLLKGALFKIKRTLPLAILCLALLLTGFWVALGLPGHRLNQDELLPAWLAKGVSLLPFFEWAYGEPRELVVAPWSESRVEPEKSRDGSWALTVGRLTGRDSITYGPQAIAVVGRGSRRAAYILDSCNKRIIRIGFERGRYGQGMTTIGLKCKGFPVSMAILPADGIVVLTRSGEVILTDGMGEKAEEVSFQVVAGGEEGLVGSAQRIGCLPDGSVLVYDAWIETDEYKQRVAKYGTDGHVRGVLVRRVVRRSQSDGERHLERGDAEGHPDAVAGEVRGRGIRGDAYGDMREGDSAWYLSDFIVGSGNSPPIYLLYYRTGVPSQPPTHSRRDREFRAGTPLRLEAIRFAGSSVRSRASLNSHSSIHNTEIHSTEGYDTQDYERPERLGGLDFEAPGAFQTLGFLGVDGDGVVYVGGFDQFGLKWVMAFEKGSRIRGSWRIRKEDKAWMESDGDKTYGSEGDNGIGMGIDGKVQQGAVRPEGSIRPVMMAYPATVLSDGDVVQMVATDSALSIQKYDMRLRLRRSGGDKS